MAEGKLAGAKEAEAFEKSVPQPPPRPDLHGRVRKLYLHAYSCRPFTVCLKQKVPSSGEVKMKDV